MLHSTEEILTRIERLLTDSPAARTSVVWCEERAGSAGHGGRARPPGQTFSRTVVVGVEEAGRTGTCAVASDDPAFLLMAVREALAAARLDPGPPWGPPPPSEAGEEGPPLHDPGLAALTPEAAAKRLAGLLEKRGSGQLSWWEARLVVADSRGLRRAAALTAGALELRWGRRAGAGHAAHAARSLAGLDPERVAARARSRHPGADLEEGGLAPGEAPAVVLAGEAAARLLAAFSAAAFDGHAYAVGDSWLARGGGELLLSPLLDVEDDPLSAAGLPLPFDFEGRPKGRHPLLVRGRPGAPVTDAGLAARIGQAETAHALGGGAALPLHPRLAPGEESEEELRRAAEGGIWIGEVGPPELFDRVRLGTRLVARGVRRIGPDGALAEPLADLGWEGELGELFGAVAGVGRESVCRPAGGGWLGGAVAPALRLSRLAGLYPLAPRG